MKKIIIAITVVALLIGGVSAYAVQREKSGGLGNSCGLSEDQIKILNDKIKTDIDEMLANEEITKEQYEQIIKSVEKGRLPSSVKKMPEMKPDKKGNQHEMTEEQKTKMLELHKENLKKQLDSGKITQEEYDELIKKAEKGEFMPGRKSFGEVKDNKAFEGRKMPEFKEGEKSDFKNMPFRGEKNKFGDKPAANEEVK